MDLDLDPTTRTKMADEVGRWWETRIRNGERETYDPFAGLWLTDARLIANHVARSPKRAILGDENTAHAMNLSGVGDGAL